MSGIDRMVDEMDDDIDEARGLLDDLLTAVENYFSPAAKGMDKFEAKTRLDFAMQHAQQFLAGDDSEE